MATAHKPKPRAGKTVARKRGNVVSFKSAKAKHKSKQIKYPKAERESRLNFSKGEGALVKQGSYEPDDKDRSAVTRMSAHGLTHDAIASILKISKVTLEKHFADELSIAAHQACEEVAKNLFLAAKRGNVQAMIFWLSRRARNVWAENPTRYPGQDPLPVNRPDYSKLTNEEIDDLRRLVAKTQTTTVDVSPTAAITVDSDD
jgi:hypothetical protein